MQSIPSLRIELFPSSLPVSLSFYTDTLSFTVQRHHPSGNDQGYAHIHRTGSPFSIGLSTQPSSTYPSAASSPSQRAQFRKWPLGAELVLDIGTLEELHAERSKILASGWPLETDLKLQEWGLWDFRLVDPDGYYWRITERGGEDGQGTKEQLARS